MAIEKYIIDKSDLTALLKGEDLKIQPKGNIKGFCVEIAGNLTNGDMINALFPNAKNIRVDGGYPLNYIIEGEWHRNLKEWWNAPYKSESEEKE